MGPPGQWLQGHVQFINVRLQYSPELPEALAGTSFELRPGQKVGICGRTGVLPLPHLFWVSPTSTSVLHITLGADKHEHRATASCIEPEGHVASLSWRCQLTF